jgi:hypothetical protein
MPEVLNLMSTGSVALTNRFKTGEKNLVRGDFIFDGYLDGSFTPSPTSEEMVIPLEFLETFPPIRSAQKACYWRLLFRR